MRALYFLAFVLVVLGLGCAEMPELLTICDNTSNDFTVSVSSSKQASGQAAATSVAAASLPASDCGRCADRWREAAGPQILPLTGRDLLTLHSLQRK